jgi:hypothetical protein
MGEPARDATRWRRELLHDITRVDLSRLDNLTGLRAAAFVITPALVGVATGFLFQGLFATIGANFLTSTEGGGPNATRLKILAAACLIEPSAFALGTLTGSTGLLAIPVVGLGVFVFLMMKTYTSWAQVAIITSLVFVVGVGLPGASVSGATERFWTSMAGDLWAFCGVAIQRWGRTPTDGVMGTRGMTHDLRHLHPFFSDMSVHSEVFRQSLVTAVAAAIGLAIGLSLSLPRDIWIMITVIISIRAGLGPTVNSTVTIVVGTAVGAVIAAVVTLGVSGVDVLIVLLFLFTFAMNATRFVNQVLFQALVTPFLIILLDIIYPGDWRFALVRIVDVAIGGCLAVIAVYLLCLELNRTGPGRRPRAPS